MEVIPVKRLWRRRGYNKLSPKVKIVKFGGSKRSWRLRVAPKLRLIRPLKLWYKLKNAYMKMMLNFANYTGTSNSPNIFGAKRVPQARPAPMAYSKTHFQNRLLLEIYKSMLASLELGYHK